jgi:hypothetical protein
MPLERPFVYVFKFPFYTNVCMLKLSLTFRNYFRRMVGAMLHLQGQRIPWGKGDKPFFYPPTLPWIDPSKRPDGYRPDQLLPELKEAIGKTLLNVQYP